MLLQAVNLLPRALALLLIQLAGCRPGQAPLRPIHNRDRHFQIADQLGAGRGRSFLLLLPLRFEKQSRFIEDPSANRRRTVAPGGIQLARLPRVAVMLDKDRRHALAILQALPRHRNQELHGRLRCNLALANLLLDRLRQQLHQRQPSRHPAQATIKPPRQLLQAVAETLLHLRQQPALFQRALLFG